MGPLGEPWATSVRGITCDCDRSKFTVAVFVKGATSESGANFYIRAYWMISRADETRAAFVHSSCCLHGWLQPHVLTFSLFFGYNSTIPFVLHLRALGRACFFGASAAVASIRLVRENSTSNRNAARNEPWVHYALDCNSWRWLKFFSHMVHCAEDQTLFRGFPNRKA